MAIYSYYRSEEPGGSLQELIQSAELNSLRILPTLNRLASMRALVPGGQHAEMMLYRMEYSGYGILGLSYSEKQNISGDYRKMNCSLQYVAPEKELAGSAAEMSRIVNFINFQKPPASSPAPLTGWPLMESGYCYHNSTAVLAPLVDGLARVAMSPGDTVMLIGLPREKKNAYAFARYTMAELLGFLPEPVRTNIRFFTGLPVEEGVTDAGAGFDNAVRFGANVIFCPHDYFSLLRQYRQCISADMDQPSAEYGAFADYITRMPDVPLRLAALDSLLSGPVTYESLNGAAETIRKEGFASFGEMRRELDASRQSSRDLERKIDLQDEEYDRLCDDYEELQKENQELKAESLQTADSGALTEELRKEIKQRQEKIEAIGRKLKEKEQAYQQLQREYAALAAQQPDPGEKPVGTAAGPEAEAQAEKLRKTEEKLAGTEDRLRETERKLKAREQEYSRLNEAHQILQSARDDLMEQAPNGMTRLKQILLGVLVFFLGFLFSELMQLAGRV